MKDNKYTSEDLKIMQSWPLERKIQFRRNIQESALTILH